MRTSSVIETTDRHRGRSSLALSLEQSSAQLSEWVLKSRYLLKNEKGEVIETPDELWRRVAKAVAAAERDYRDGLASEGWEEEFYRVMSQGLFLPNSPTLFSAGQDPQMLSACFVLRAPDSLEGLLQMTKEAGLIEKDGGGVGFDFSPVRAKGAMVRGAPGVASGPVSFMEAINAWSQVIKQGRLRRAANMAVLRTDHPDIEEFITCKSVRGGLETFNLSVGITDDFMAALRKEDSYSIVDPRTGKEIERRDAGKTWDLLSHAAWKCGDPGVVFLDTINASNPTPLLGAIGATNPCGEQPLLPYESCNLGSVNLSKMVGNGDVNWDTLRETIKIAVRFLDDVIDVNAYPLPQIAEVTKGNRKIGLGVMGLAHMLIKLGIPYDSEKAIETAGNVMRYVSEQALEASRQLARERGPFPNFDKSIYAERGEPPVRNATRTTVAPTGTISIIANTSSGIEPLIAVAYSRTAADREFLLFDPLFKEVAHTRGIYTEHLARQVAKTGSLRNIEEVPDDLKALFRTAYEILPEQHVRMQASIQNWTDNAVSKTVNLPSSATVEDVKRLLLLSHELTSKGITVFRQGSRTGVLTAGARGRQFVTMRERAKVVLGQTEKFRTGCGSLYVHVNHDERGLLEAFSNLGKAGGCPAQSEATARLVSLCLRCDVDPQEVVRQLRGIRCPTACSKQAAGKAVDVLSCPDGIAQAIRRTMADELENGSGKEPLEVCWKCGGPREPGRCGLCLSCLQGGCGGS